jgi:hypothetical protein
MDKKWEELSVSERQEQRLEAWAAPEGVTYKSPEAEKSYKAKAGRIKDAIIQKKLPDRGPVIPLTGTFPALYSGNTFEEVMYDYDKLNTAFKKFFVDFDPDAQTGNTGPSAGKMYDILDWKLYRWPGHGVSPKSTYQCVEGEYMKAEELDMFLMDPSYFILNRYFPRIFNKLEAFNMLPHFTDVQEMYGGFSAVQIIPFGIPPVQEALKTLMEAGNEAMKWIQVVVAYEQDMMASGFPNIFGGGCKAPFDVLGDTLRGTKGIMMDMYRQPDKLLKAVERIIPMSVQMGAGASIQNKNPMVFMPLHKGADGFLSDEQFRKFYWPSLKAVLEGLIAQGCVPLLFVEGGYNSRLDVISKDLPKGHTIWLFDLTDMARAKKLMGDKVCLAGNMPIALLNVGTAEQVKDYARKLIDVCGKGGGYIMMNGAVIDESKPENVKAMVDFTKEYGVYK